MSKLPITWVEAEIGDLCDLINGRAFKPSDWTDDGLPIVRIQNLNNPNKAFNRYDGEVRDKFLIESGDLLFAWSGTPGTSFGAHVWKGERAVLNQHIFNVKFNRKNLDRDFFKHAINQKLNELIDKAHGGGGLRHVTKGKFEETKISIPPLPEQRRIVRKLDALSNRTAAARNHLSAIANLVDRYQASVLNEIMVAPEAVKKSWKPTTLEQIRDKSASIRYGVVQPGEIKDEGVPLIRVCDLLGGMVAWPELRRVSSEIDEAYAKARVQDDDVLVSVVGTIGRVALVKGLTEKTNIARAVSRIRPNKQLVEPKWLFWRLSASDIQDRFNGDAREVARKTLNIGLIKETPFRLPTLEEQKETVRQIETAFAKISLLVNEAEKALRLTNRLDQRILAKAFAGELVHQDPTDEPAGVLLERIRAERASTPKSKRGRQKQAGAVK